MHYINLFSDILYANSLKFARFDRQEIKGAEFIVSYPVWKDRPALAASFSVSNSGDIFISAPICRVIESTDAVYQCLNEANRHLSYGHLVLADGDTVFLKAGFLIRTCDEESSEYLLNQYLSLFQKKILPDAKHTLQQAEVKFVKGQEENEWRK